MAIKKPIPISFNLDGQYSVQSVCAVIHIDDNNTETLDLSLMQGGEHIAVSPNSTVTARFVRVKDKILISDNVPCAVQENGNILIPIDNAAAHMLVGEIKIEVNIVDENDILTMQFPLVIRVNNTILADAEISPESEGTIPELLEEAREAAESATQAAEAATEAISTKQDKLTAGDNITISEENVISASSGSNDYTDLINKPSINNVTLSGSKTSDDLNLQGKLTAGNNITINNGVISASGVTSYFDLDDKPIINGRTNFTSYVDAPLIGKLAFNEEDFRVHFTFNPTTLTDNCFFVSLSPNIPINYIATDDYHPESYDFNILKGKFANSGTFKIPIINLINKPSELNDLTGNVFITHYFQDCEYRETISLIRVAMGKDINDNNLCFWQITEVTNIGSHPYQYNVYEYSVSNSSLWQELTGGGSQIVSGVVNANGTITFTDSEGNSFTTSGESVIGADGFSPVATVTQTASGATITVTDKNGITTANITNGQDGNDYVLTTQDKDDIADIVLSELPTTQGVLYGNQSN